MYEPKTECHQYSQLELNFEKVTYLKTSIRQLSDPLILGNWQSAHLPVELGTGGANGDAGKPAMKERYLPINTANMLNKSWKILNNVKNCIKLNISQIIN